MLIRLTAPLTIIRNGITHDFKAGDVIQTGAFPEAAEMIKQQTKKGRIEKDGLVTDA